MKCVVVEAILHHLLHWVIFFLLNNKYWTPIYDPHDYDEHGADWNGSLTTLFSASHTDSLSFLYLIVLQVFFFAPSWNSREIVIPVPILFQNFVTCKLYYYTFLLLLLLYIWGGFRIENILSCICFDPYMSFWKFSWLAKLPNQKLNYSMQTKQNVPGQLDLA